MASSQQLVGAARRYVGTPFRHQGRSTAGLDCVGLLVRVAWDCGLTVRDRDGYGREPHRGLLRAGLQENLIPVTDMQPGDVLEMRIVSDPQHVALYTGTTLIHALWQRGGGAVREHSFDQRWRDRVVRVYRFPGVD